MTARNHTVMEARRRADAARIAFRAASISARERIAPGRLKEDAVVAVTNRLNETRSASVALVKRRPVLSVLIGGTLAALLFWRPVIALSRGSGKLARTVRDRIEQWRMTHGNAQQEQPAEQEGGEQPDQHAQERV
ncbi:hypothetical protein [Sphingobium sp. CR28]|uniref:hypothetical protein n=1 Tax=Sphingobium sp. CR28 TaxID=3400272 RepID=UPI003FEF5376